MQNSPMPEYTVRVSRPTNAEQNSNDLIFTVFDGTETPRTCSLNSFRKSIVTFGRSDKNDVVLSSPLVSREHGRFCYRDGQWIIEDRGLFGERPSENGLIFNNTTVLSRALSDGDFIRIDDGVETVSKGVLFVFSSQQSSNRWNTLPLDGKQELRIGRDADCDIVLPHISISKCHARIIRERELYYITDNNSTNGLLVNNRRVSGRHLLHEKDVIVITNSKLIFTSAAVYYCCYKSGISVDASDLVITRGRGRKKNVAGNYISLNFRPGELVAIVGGSGAGKSTVLNCVSGYLPPAAGEVYINGINLYQNLDSAKKLIGYVPQSDIVYDNLTLHDMLSYTAKLRLPKDAAAREREDAIDRAIALVELKDKKNSLIKNLSGGQKKRASIAVELLSDPNLLFLDEPASGLDPGTERNLMLSLREMADRGKTVILVTHSTLQLKLCDKIVFMGKGGNLCFFGSYEDALHFFGVSDIIDVYDEITGRAPEWRSKYDSLKVQPGPTKNAEEAVTNGKSRQRFQLPVLCARYLKLVLHDKQRLLLLLLQAPVLAFLISLVADGQQFRQYEMTESLLFALACSAFWIGILNAIQEVCKERSILKREFMTGLSLNEYLLSKIIVLALLCLLQSALLVGTFALAVGLPQTGVLLSPFAELLVTTFLTAIASSSMGLFVSSLFTNADRAMTVAPILLMPQLLFSGMIFKLSGVTNIVSWLAVCRWSMEGFGTTANLNQLDLKLQQQGVIIAHEADPFFDFTKGHIVQMWLTLLAFLVVFMVLARLVLSKIAKEKS